ncbi:MAG: hypothetical protein C0394_01010 [Syntrophus sp. (in: bacteria)]|nr:hypothetical protein [Syntrophus sp. (in: bacteria)]
MLRCVASIVIAAYARYASFLRICAPCLRTFYEAVEFGPFFDLLRVRHQLMMNLIDEPFTKTPFYGVPRMTAWLRRQGHEVNRNRICRLMRRMGSVISRMRTGETRMTVPVTKQDENKSGGTLTYLRGQLSSSGTGVSPVKGVFSSENELRKVRSAGCTRLLLCLRSRWNLTIHTTEKP